MYEFGFKQLTAKNLTTFNAQFETITCLTSQWQEAFFATSMSSDEETPKSPKQIIQTGSSNLIEKLVDQVTQGECEQIFLELADDKPFSNELLKKSSTSNVRRKLVFDSNNDEQKIQDESEDQTIRENLMNSPSSKIPHVRRISSSSDESEAEVATECESPATDEHGLDHEPDNQSDKKDSHDLTNKKGYILNVDSDDSETDDEPTEADRNFISDSEEQIIDQSLYRQVDQIRTEKGWRSELEDIKLNFMRYVLLIIFTLGIYFLDRK